MAKILVHTGVLICLALLSRGPLAAAPVIEVEALFTGAAVLSIDGERKTLREGQSHRGVTLVSAYSRTATLEVDGRQMVLGISRRIGANYEEPGSRVVNIRRNANLQYRTEATINGRRVPVLVDTGANIMAMNSSQAAALGVDYFGGSEIPVETASGRVRAWLVTLDHVNVGGIRVDNVSASVLEGDFPVTVLLGMSYLKHVDLSETDGTLSLSRPW